MELRVIQGARYSQARERRVLFSLLGCGVCPRTWELERWTQSGPLADRRDCNRRGRQCSVGSGRSVVAAAGGRPVCADAAVRNLGGGARNLFERDFKS